MYIVRWKRIKTIFIILQWHPFSLLVSGIGIFWYLLFLYSHCLISRGRFHIIVISYYNFYQSFIFTWAVTLYWWIDWLIDWLPSHIALCLASWLVSVCFVWSSASSSYRPHVFNSLLFTFTVFILHDEAPRYLADLCVPAASTDGRRQSRSAVSGALLVTWTQTSMNREIVYTHK